MIVSRLRGSVLGTPTINLRERVDLAAQWATLLGLCFTLFGGVTAWAGWHGSKLAPDLDSYNGLMSWVWVGGILGGGGFLLLAAGVIVLAVLRR